MTMRLPELDALLADWQQKMGTIAHNLYEFCDLPTYQRLMGTGGMPKATLTGITQQKVAMVNSDFTYLYQLFELLRETIDRAASLRTQVPKRGGEAIMAEIETLLTGLSIGLPLQIVPIQSRDIVGASTLGDRVTLEELLNRMAETFTRSKTVVLEIDAVWNHLELGLADLQQRANPILQEMSALIAQSPMLVPVAIQQSFSAFQAQFAAVHQAIDADPLTANASLIDQIEPSLKAMEQHLFDLKAQRQSVMRSLDDGIRSLQQLRDLCGKALTQKTEWQDKIVQSQPVIIPSSEVVVELTQWLDRLSKNAQDGNFMPVKVGLSRWQAQFEIALTQVQAAIDQMTQALQQRIELRGRLIAMKAKASFMGRAEDPALCTIEAKAEKVLYSRPTDLQVSQQLIGEYERSLNYRA
jgi:regulator of sigma D